MFARYRVAVFSRPTWTVIRSATEVRAAFILDRTAGTLSPYAGCRTCEGGVRCVPAEFSHNRANSLTRTGNVDRVSSNCTVMPSAPESAKRVKHPATFPVDLVDRLLHLYAYPKCHVLDPFGGSGTVGVAAKRLGCNATLLELNKEYCTIAKDRINNG